MSADLRIGRETYSWWKKAKFFCNVRKIPQPIPTLFNPKPAITDAQKSDLLCLLFASYSQVSQTPTSSNTKLPSTSTFSGDSLFSISSLTEKQVVSALKLLSSHHQTSGSIPNTMLRAMSWIITPLTALLNMISATGTFLKDWKLAMVVPIHKGGSKSVASNYRPISLLNSVAKMYESLISQQILWFCQRKWFACCWSVWFSTSLLNCRPTLSLSLSAYLFYILCSW